MSDELRGVERRIREWATRPPSTSPRIARARVLARIQERRRWAGWKLAAAAVALAVALASGLLVFAPARRPGAAVDAPAAEPSQRLLIYELESGTRLYLALAAKKGNGR